jgi:hypothetical protein
VHIARNIHPHSGLVAPSEKTDIPAAGFYLISIYLEANKIFIRG